MITPLPGTDKAHLARTLRQLAMRAANIRSSGAVDPFRDYIKWANDAVLLLRGQLSDGDLDRLFLTRRYWLLQSLGAQVTAPVTMLLETELDERAREIDETVKDLEQRLERWQRSGAFVVADTSFYLRHHDKLEDVDFGFLGLNAYLPINVVVPMVVVDELDRLKDSGKNQVRWRSGYSLAVLEDRLRSTEVGVLRRQDESSTRAHCGEVKIEVLFDSPGHVRLPNDDDELIDRAVAAQWLTYQQELTFVTYDTGQSMRARSAGIRNVIRLRRQQDEPGSGTEPHG